MTWRVVVVLFVLGCGNKASEPAAAAGSGSAAPPAPAPVFEEHVRGPGPCQWVDGKHVSTVLGVQMESLSPEADDVNCHLLMSSDHRSPPDFTVAPFALESAASQWDTVSVPVTGFPDKAGWTGGDPDERFIVVRGKWLVAFHLIWPQQTQAWRREKVEAIARKVMAELPAEPPAAGSAH